MRYNVCLALAAATLAPLASGHYTFSSLLVNGSMVGREWQYIRRHERTWMPTFVDEATTSNDFRCNKGASSSGSDTDVYTVRPGDTVGMKLAYERKGLDHPGPAQVYISRAPGSVKEYDGSGEWIKVTQTLVCKPNTQPKDLQKDGWCSWGEDNVNFVVPDSIPEGEYLVRGEHIALHIAHDNKAEFYYSCAQVRVEGSSGSSLPGEKVRIPGVYEKDDPTFSFSVWNRNSEFPHIPGPDVAPGGTIRGSADGSSSAVVVVPAGNSGGGNTSSGGGGGGSQEPSSSDSGNSAATPTPAAPSPVYGGNNDDETTATTTSSSSTSTSTSPPSSSSSSSKPTGKPKPGHRHGKRPRPSGCPSSGRRRRHGHRHHGGHKPNNSRRSVDVGGVAGRRYRFRS